MTGLLNALGLVKSLAAVGALTAATVFAGTGAVSTHASAAPTALPAQAENAGDPVATILQSQADLLDRLKEVLAALQANPNVDDHARTALENVIARLGDAEHGLLNAASRVSSHRPSSGNPGASHPVPSLPPQASGHPSAPDHPTASDHPSASSHPGRP